MKEVIFPGYYFVGLPKAKAVRAAKGFDRPGSIGVERVNNSPVDQCRALCILEFAKFSGRNLDHIGSKPVNSFVVAPNNYRPEIFVDKPARRQRNVVIAIRRLYFDAVKKCLGSPPLFVLLKAPIFDLCFSGAKSSRLRSSYAIANVAASSNQIQTGPSEKACNWV
ncbi:hypothetical protein [Vulgatibacter incomptus]|uniref:hypothetical protein n=1 Tax=Vulgatibacter incomptus TaxID=1391653 RepID=UPI00196A0516|nr:hypothetical protein [Vulgatibacter incomptus]